MGKLEFLFKDDMFCILSILLIMFSGIFYLNVTTWISNIVFDITNPDHKMKTNSFVQILAFIFTIIWFILLILVIKY